MGLSDRLPGMKPGSHIRNVIVGGAYVFVLLAIIGAILNPGGGDPAPATGDLTDTPMAADGGTPTATEVSTPTSSPPPTPSPIPEPDPIEFSDSGETVSGRFTVQGGFTAFAMEHDGESNFAVELINAETGETVELLANQIGTWDGRTASYVPPGEYILDVTADGSWSIEVTQPRPTADEARSVPVELTGDTANYHGPIEFDGLVTVSGEHDGDSNFAVWVVNIRGERVELLFNEIGQFEGETTFNADGIGWIIIEANGDYTIEISAA